MQAQLQAQQQVQQVLLQQQAAAQAQAQQAAVQQGWAGGGGGAAQRGPQAGGGRGGRRPALVGGGPGHGDEGAGARYQHHAFIPKNNRSRSALMRRHDALHGAGRAPASARAARPGMLEPLSMWGSPGQGEPGEGWSHVSSMGDLEALDTILDTLVGLGPGG